METKKPSSRQNENEGTQRIPSAHAKRAGLILLLTEKLAAVSPKSKVQDPKWANFGHYASDFGLRQPDERNRIGILTSGMNLAPAFPTE
jgi:hypothetical protein